MLPSCTCSIPAAASILHSPAHPRDIPTVAGASPSPSPLLPGLEIFGQEQLPTAHRPPALLQPPTPELLADVQAGAPGEAFHRPVLQPGQPRGQSLQLIGTPLPPVQKHPGVAAGGPPWSRARPAGATGGTSRGSPALALRAGPGLWTSGAFMLAAGSRGAAEGAAGGCPAPARGAHKGPFFSLLQTLHKFHFPLSMKDIRPRRQDALVIKIIGMKRGLFGGSAVGRLLRGAGMCRPEPWLHPRTRGHIGGPQPARGKPGVFRGVFPPAKSKKMGKHQIGLKTHKGSKGRHLCPAPCKTLLKMGKTKTPRRTISWAETIPAPKLIGINSIFSCRCHMLPIVLLLLGTLCQKR